MSQMRRSTGSGLSSSASSSVSRTRRQFRSGTYNWSSSRLFSPSDDLREGDFGVWAQTGDFYSQVDFVVLIKAAIKADAISGTCALQSCMSPIFCKHKHMLSHSAGEHQIVNDTRSSFCVSSLCKGFDDIFTQEDTSSRIQPLSITAHSSDAETTHR